jgi:hypothetical protein
MGRQPAPFSQYSFPLLRFSRENHFVYKYRDWPAPNSSALAARQASSAQDISR